MSISELTDYFLRYGAFFIYLIVLLEYLNLPGFPAGVIMPLAGIWAAKGEISFPMVMVLTVFAGLTGSWALYLLGRFGGGKVMEFYFKKFPKHRPVIEEKMAFLREKGGTGVFVSKLLPMVRTLISIPLHKFMHNFSHNFLYHLKNESLFNNCYPKKLLKIRRENSDKGEKT